jgi:hypothetical protein
MGVIMGRTLRRAWRWIKVNFRWRYQRNKRVPPVLDLLVSFILLWLILVLIGGSGLAESFFAGLAFLGVIYAIVLQKHELGLQRQELRLTRIEMEANRQETKRIADANQKSEEALGKQAESLLLAAYLNALGALHDTIDPKDVRSEAIVSRALVQSRVEALLKLLEEKAGLKPTELWERQTQIILVANLRFHLGHFDEQRFGNTDIIEKREIFRAIQKYIDEVCGDLSRTSSKLPSSLAPVSAAIKHALSLSHNSRDELAAAHHAFVLAWMAAIAWAKEHAHADI